MTDQGLREFDSWEDYFTECIVNVRTLKKNVLNFFFFQKLQLLNVKQTIIFLNITFSLSFWLV